MSRLSILYQELEYWIGRRDFYNAEIVKYEKRLKQVKNIIRQLKSSAANGTYSVNTDIRWAENQIASGIRYDAQSSELSSITEGKQEKEIDEDYDLSTTNTALHSEKDSIEQKLEELRASRDNALQQISQKYREIAEEKRREEDE